MSRMPGARLVALFALCLSAWLVASPASAGASSTVGISDVKVVGTSTQGVLTFRSSDVVDVDRASVKATIDGKDVSITVQQSTHISRAAMLVIDTSGSMGTAGMATVRSATASYLHDTPADVRIGVVTFSTTAGVDLKPTLDRAAVQRVANGLVANGDTSLYAAMRDAASTVGAIDGDRSIVLLSDGADTMSKNPSADLAKVTAALKAKQIRVDVVRFNNNDPTAVQALNRFAAAAGGSVVSAQDSATVGSAFRTAARALQSQAQFVVSSGQLAAGRHDLTISGMADGKPFTSSYRVDITGAGHAATPSAPQTAAAVPPKADVPTPAAHSSWVPWVAALAIGGALFLLAFAMLNPSFQTHRERRLATVQEYTIEKGRGVAHVLAKPKDMALTERLTAIAERFTRGHKWTERTMHLIDQADLPFRAGEWAILRVVAMIIGIAVAMLLFGDAKLVGAIVGGLVGLTLPVVFLRIKAARRASAFERLLPQALLLASTSLRSGFSLNQSLESVAKDSPEPVAKELSRALGETRIGTDITDALERVSERMSTESMKMTVMAIRIQREVGGNLAETLETTARTLREREALHGQVRALSAEGRLSAYILIALPICLFIYMLMVNYDYISLLWTTGLGMLMAIGAVVAMVIGIFWMRKTVQIEV